MVVGELVGRIVERGECLTPLLVRFGLVSVGSDQVAAWAIYLVVNGLARLSGGGYLDVACLCHCIYGWGEMGGSKLGLITRDSHGMEGVWIWSTWDGCVGWHGRLAYMAAVCIAIMDME